LAHLYLNKVHLSLVQSLSRLRDGHTDGIILGLDISDQPGTLQQDIKIRHCSNARRMYDIYFFRQKLPFDLLYLNYLAG
jgi:hypothetical protein